MPAQGSKRPHDTTGEATRPSARRPRDRQVPSTGSEVTEGHIVQAVAAQEDLGVQRDRLAELRVGRSVAIKHAIDGGVGQRELAQMVFGGSQMQPWVRAQATAAGKELGAGLAGSGAGSGGDRAELIEAVRVSHERVLRQQMAVRAAANVRAIEVWRAVRAGLGPSVVAGRLGSTSPVAVLGWLVAPTTETADLHVEGDVAEVVAQAEGLADVGHQVWVEMSGGGRAGLWVRWDPRVDAAGFEAVVLGASGGDS